MATSVSNSRWDAVDSDEERDIIQSLNVPYTSFTTIDAMAKRLIQEYYYGKQQSNAGCSTPMPHSCETSTNCGRCGAHNSLITDNRQGDIICKACAYVVVSSIVSQSAACRVFEDREDRTHHGKRSAWWASADLVLATQNGISRVQNKAMSMRMSDASLQDIDHRFQKVMNLPTKPTPKVVFDEAFRIAVHHYQTRRHRANTSIVAAASAIAAYRHMVHTKQLNNDTCIPPPRYNAKCALCHAMCTIGTPSKHPFICRNHPADEVRQYHDRHDTVQKKKLRFEKGIMMALPPNKRRRTRRECKRQGKRQRTSKKCIDEWME